ncbi:MAG TPA: DUF2254 domain-containing protein [Dehalococcoidia bacterium]|nr:DUF2254 domain-containing protein [Dehalococcoidia bacterium]
MATRALNLWYEARSSFWLVPLLMAAGAAALSTLTVWLDTRVDLGDDSVVYGGSADGARELMATLAGSMITVAGVVFSVTVVTLSLTSSQYGPRILRNFMRDPGNQFVLGTFIATFLYCLLVLRTIRGGETVDEGSVPSISISIGIALAILSIVVLIYFIHHAASSIQANNLVAVIGHDLDRSIERFLQGETDSPRAGAADQMPEQAPRSYETGAIPIAANGSGYVTAVNLQGLIGLAAERDMVLLVDQRPGQYVIPGTALARAWPGGDVGDELAASINAHFILGNVRTLEQDVEFAADQLVEMAVRALSPSVNDPFTAIACVDRLGSSIAGFMRGDCPSASHYDAEGRVRVITTSHVTFRGMMDAAFNQIRQNAGSHVSVWVRLLETIGRLGLHARTSEHRGVLAHHAEIMVRGARASIREPNDLRDLEDRYEKALASIERAKAPAGAGPGRAGVA